MTDKIIEVLDFIKNEKNNGLYKTVDDLYKTNNGTLYRDNINTHIPNEIENIINSHEDLDSGLYKFDGSVGKGMLGVVPHNAILYKDLTTSTQNGVYLVLLYSADGSCIYLSLGQGATEIESKVKNMIDITPKQLSLSLAEEYRKSLIKLGIDESKYVKEIDLKSSSKRPKSYEDANIFAKRYTRDTIHNFAVDLLEMMRIYKLFTDNNLYINDEKDVIILADKKFESFETTEYRIGEKPSATSYTSTERNIAGLSQAKHAKGRRAEESALEIFTKIFGSDNVEDTSTISTGYDIRIRNLDRTRGIEVKNISHKKYSCLYLSKSEIHELEKGNSRLLLVDHNQYYLSRPIEDSDYLSNIISTYQEDYLYDENKWLNKPYSVEAESIKICFHSKKFYEDFVSFTTLKANDNLTKEFLTSFLNI